MSYMVEPKMQECADEITASLKKHNLMGAVFISSPTRSGFIHEMSPPWSCIQMIGDEIRIKSKSVDYPSKEAQSKAISETLSGIMGMIHNSESVFTTLKSLVMMVGQKINISSIVNDSRIQRAKIEGEE